MIERHECFEMALTEADFARLLPVAVGGKVQSAHQGFSGCSNGVTWRIALERLPERRIASLALPRLMVNLRLVAEDMSPLDEFLRRFQLGYQRAGG